MQTPVQINATSWNPPHGAKITPLALLVSDIHLSHTAPTARQGEPDWYDAMRKPLRFIKAKAEELDVPIVCAGDVFDKWNPPTELINFAMDELPPMYCVPGQHDLPGHNYEGRMRAAYGILMKAGIIHDIDPNVQHTIIGKLGREVRLVGVPWNHSAPDFAQPGWHLHYPPTLAVIHEYVWRSGTGYKDAPETAHVAKWNRKLNQCHAAVFGDNHIPFTAAAIHPETDWECSVYNHGGFMRRVSDNTWKPQYGVMVRYEDRNTIDILTFDMPTDGEIFEPLAKDAPVTNPIDMSTKEFVDMLAAAQRGEMVNFIGAFREMALRPEIDAPTRAFLVSQLEHLTK